MEPNHKQRSILSQDFPSPIQAQGNPRIYKLIYGFWSYLTNSKCSEYETPHLPSPFTMQKKMRWYFLASLAHIASTDDLPPATSNLEVIRSQHAFPIFCSTKKLTLGGTSFLQIALTGKLVPPWPESTLYKFLYPPHVLTLTLTNIPKVLPTPPPRPLSSFS